MAFKENEAHRNYQRIDWLRAIDRDVARELAKFKTNDSEHLVLDTRNSINNGRRRAA